MNNLQENLLRRTTLGDLLTRSALRFGTRTALVYQGTLVSYQELNSKSCQAAHAFLQLGIERGDRVAFMTHNCLEYLYCRFGLAKIGAIPVPINFSLKAKEINFIINNSKPKLFFIEDSLVQEVLPIQDELPSIKEYGMFSLNNQHLVPEGWIDVRRFFSGSYSDSEIEVYVESDDTATLIYTTGTEGNPKGVMTSHLNYYMSIFHFVSDVNMNRDDVVLIDLPLFHVAGTTILMGALSTGAKACIEYAPDPINILKKTQDEKVTMWTYPPTLYYALPTMPNFQTYNLSSLQKCITFGSVMPKPVLEKWKKIKPDIQWRNYWGQTESTPVGTTSMPEDFEENTSSIGVPDTGVTVKILNEHGEEVKNGEVGELVIRGAAVMKGYWENEELTKQTLRGGWLHTGDLGYRNEKGQFFFVDRIKDMIKTGGENVSSLEVESVLQTHPKIAIAAVLGLPHPHWMEAVTAHIVVVKDQTATKEEIIAYCKEHLAGFKVPKEVTFWDQLPTSPSGKILKTVIRDQLNSKQMN